MIRIRLRLQKKLCNKYVKGLTFLGNWGINRVSNTKVKVVGIMDNKIMLITYPDSMGNNLKDLKRILNKYFSKAVYSIHILPFFPSSGDRGFAPTTYDEVCSAFGDWNDIEELADDYPLMFDYMINHISAQSSYYQDFLKNKDRSPYAELFIRYKNFWKNGMPSEEQADMIYKRKPRLPYVMAHFDDESEEAVWCTFGEEQIDLNMDSSEGKKFLENNLRSLSRKGASVIRLDAFAYAVKKPDTSCFFVEPEIWELLERCSKIAGEENALILPEIHEHYSIQKKLADRGYYVYDFALPMLLLHALYFGKSSYLRHWFEICPRKQFTTLDTHDGIGVVDVRGLLPDEEIDATKEHLFKYGANVKRVYNTEKYNNLDIYQINCTYYSALGDNDNAYLMARAIQFFAPGTPQVYYVGMLAGKNDIGLLERTKEGRNINRHYYSETEIATEVQRPVVTELLKLMELRNTHDAFNGEFYMRPSDEEHLILGWKNGDSTLELHADIKNLKFEII